MQMPLFAYGRLLISRGEARARERASLREWELCSDCANSHLQSMCAYTYVFVSVCRFSLFKPVTGARVYFFLSNFPDPVEPIVLRNGNPFGFFRISFGLTRLMNGVLRSEKDKQVLPHMHAHTHTQRGACRQTFSVWSLSFFALGKQTKRRLRLPIFNFQFLQPVLLFLLPVPPEVCAFVYVFYVQPARQLKPCLTSKKKPFDIRLTNLSRRRRRRRRRRVCTRTAKISF